jgi:hypothetical protein
MNLQQAEKFFDDLGSRLPTATVIVLTGGIAASLLADPRTTDDIDFALIKPVMKDWPKVQDLLESLARKHGILLQYSEDIDRWSSITYLDWKKHTRPYRRAGALEVRIMEPLYFSIGKIARGTKDDVKDLESVLKAQKVAWKPLLNLWVKALYKSPPSSSQFNAKKQMERFIVESGKNIWGPDFIVSVALEFFRNQIEKTTSL